MTSQELPKSGPMVMLGALERGNSCDLAAFSLEPPLISAISKATGTQGHLELVGKED